MIERVGEKIQRVEDHQDSDISETEDPLYTQLRAEKRSDQVNRILGQLGIDSSETSKETDDQH